MNTLLHNLDELKQRLTTPEDHKLLELIEHDIKLLKTKRGAQKFFTTKEMNSALETVRYDDELKKLQVELVKLQNWVYENGKRLMIIFEGRDAAGKGGAIKRFTEHLNPRRYRVVALPKPSEVEMGQFYFQRYMKELPNPGEIVFFDRSWYNRAVVEPVFGFCTTKQYERFMQEVVEIEHALIDDGIIVVKFWFSVSPQIQAQRFKERLNNPLKQWKLSPVDKKAQQLWHEVTRYKEAMFSKSHTISSPWIIVNADDKLKARLESIRYVLSVVDYDDKEKSKISLAPDPEIVQRYHRNTQQIDS